MTGDIPQMLQRHRGHPVVVDSNLLLLLCMGRFDRGLVGTFKRLRHFNEEDFLLVERLVAWFRSVVMTPNKLTETTNLAAQLGEPKRSRFFECLRDQFVQFQETYLPSFEVAAVPEFPRLFLTDCGLTVLSKSTHLILTADLKLWLTLQANGGSAINFNHLRALGWRAC